MEPSTKPIIEYKCDCCKKVFSSKKKRSGDKFCVDCIEIRRCLRPFIDERGLTVGQVLARAGHLLLDHAEGRKG